MTSIERAARALCRLWGHPEDAIALPPENWSVLS